MASPFAVFRRNQKAMLAVIGVLAMISFVFLDPRILGFGRQGKVEDPVAVETAYGAIHESQLQRMRYTREMLRRFIGNLVEVGIEAEFKEQNPGASAESLRQQASQLASRFLPKYEQFVFGDRYPQSEAAAVQTMVMARKAEQMGMVVGDKAVNDVIRDVLQDLGPIASKKVTDSQVRQIIAGLRDNNWALGEAGFFNAMRDEILARHLIEMFFTSLGTVPPQQQFEYFVRLNRNAIVEIAPLNVAEFTKDAPEPAEDELKDMFERYKNQVPNPDSPDPGFKVPRMVQVEYFKIEQSPFIEAAKKKVTDEEIEEYYEKNKTPMFRITPPEKDRTKPSTDDPDAGDESTSADDKMPESDKAGSDKAESDKAGSDKAGSDKAGSDKAESDKAESDKAGSDKAESDNADGEKGTGEKGGDQTPNGKAPQGGTPDAESTDDKDAAPKKSATTPKQPPADPMNTDKKTDKSVSTTKPTLRLISGENSATSPRVPTGQVKAEDPKNNAEAPPKAAPKSDSAATDENKAGNAKAGNAKAANSKGKPTAENSEGDQPAPPGEGANSDPSQPIADDGEDSPEGDQPKFKPLEEVRDQIVNVIGRPKGLQAYQDAIAALQRKMNEYTSSVVLHNAGQVAEPPKKLHLAALAKEFDVSYSIFEEPLSAVDAERKTDIGKSNGQKLPFVNLVYRDEMGLYKSETTEDADNVTYLFWKIDETKEEVPTFEQARKRVAAAWKMERARGLAIKRAETYADEARKAKQPLTTVFGGAPPKLDVEKTGPFTWLSEGTVSLRMGGQPRLTEIKEVPQAGEDFLRSVFSLPEGGVAVVMNQPKTIVYVVRMDDLTPPLKDLETKFARTIATQSLALVAAEERREVAFTWFHQIESEAKVHWQRAEKTDRR